MTFKFSDYHNLGMSVMPLRGKNPLLQWKEYQTRRADISSVQAWDNTHHNIGVITGHISEILVVDVDGEYPSDWPPMPKTWTVKTKKGYHYYFYLSPDDDFKNSARICENVDIRANGGYVVAPPSKHPDGGVYEWVEGLSPNDLQILEIPDFVRKELEKKHRAIYQPTIEHVKAVSVSIDTNDARKQAYIESAIQGECDALRNTGQGGRNDQLNKSAFALAGLLPPEKVRAILEPIALEIGLNPIEIEKTIKSGCQSATPREVPEDAGVPPVEAGAADDGAFVMDDMPPLVKNILERHGRKVECNEISPHLIENAPGLVGHLARWMTETARYPLPVISLACAIPTVGTIMAHKVQTETGLRSNFFSLGIAESGSGKDHPWKVAQSLLYSLGMQDHVSGRPKSDTSVIASVKRASGQSLCLIDEMGRYLEGMVGHNAPAHTRNITTNMMGMYNSAGSFFIGDEYADNEARGGRDDIDQPCYNLYGGTVAHRFYNSLSAEEAYDGFLSRWLVFETSRFDIKANNYSGNIRDVPDHIYEQCRFWIEQPKHSGGAGGNLAQYTQIHPRVIMCSDDARKRWGDFAEDYRRKAANSNDLIDAAFYKRVGEHAAKLALIAHEGQEISLSVMEWAITLAESIMKSNIENIKANVSSSAYEAELQKVLKIIKRNGDISKSEITKATQNIDRRKRQDILDTLVEAGDVIEYKKEGAGQKQITYYKTVKGD